MPRWVWRGRGERVGGGVASCRAWGVRALGLLCVSPCPFPSPTVAPTGLPWSLSPPQVCQFDAVENVTRSLGDAGKVCTSLPRVPLTLRWQPPATPGCPGSRQAGSGSASRYRETCSVLAPQTWTACLRLQSPGALLTLSLWAFCQGGGAPCPLPSTQLGHEEVTPMREAGWDLAL